MTFQLQRNAIDVVSEIASQLTLNQVIPHPNAYNVVATSQLVYVIQYALFNFNFILPKVNTDYMRQAQVLNIDKLRLIINLRKFDENVK